MDTRAPSTPTDTDQPQTEPVILVADVVDEQTRRPARRPDHDILIAVVVDVTKGCSRLTSRSLNGSPPRAETSSNRPSPRLRNNWLSIFNGNGSARACASIIETLPLSVIRSSHESLSKSNHAGQNRSWPGSARRVPTPPFDPRTRRFPGSGRGCSSAPASW